MALNTTALFLKKKKKKKDRELALNCDFPSISSNFHHLVRYMVKLR